MYSMRMIPTAAAMAAALIFGVQAHAQTSPSTDTAASGMKKPAPAVGSDSTATPAATGATAKDAEARTAAMAEKKAARATKKAERKNRAKAAPMNQATSDSAAPAAAAK